MRKASLMPLGSGEDLRVFECLPGYPGIIHIKVDDMLFPILEVMWDHRALVVELRLHFVDVHLVEVLDDVIDGGSFLCCGRRSLLP